jgi:hypothetical protein
MLNDHEQLTTDNYGAVSITMNVSVREAPA